MPVPLQVIQTIEELRAFRLENGIREDWHEPDEQGVDAYVAQGTNFDNANTGYDGFNVSFTNDIRSNELLWVSVAQEPGDGQKGTYSETGVFLFVNGEPKAFINLALLFALATGDDV